MKVVVVAERLSGQDGSPFRTVEVFDHTPVLLKPMPGWNGTGAGMSREDYKKAFRLLLEGAKNVQALHIYLAD